MATKSISLVLFGLVMYLFSCPAYAAQVEYTFSGLVSGEPAFVSIPPGPTITNTPFQLSILGDTNNVVYLGQSPGFGPVYSNPNNPASWTIQGLGAISLSGVSVLAAPGLGAVAFGLGGQFIPDGSSTEAIFSGIVGNPPDAPISGPVPSTPVSLRTDLFTFMQFTEPAGTVNVTGFSNVNYSITPVPLPPAAVLFGSGLLSLLPLRWRRQ